MSYEVLGLIILFGSSLGLGTIILRKVPTLNELPESANEGEGESLRLMLKGKIKGSFEPYQNLSYELVLQKILTKIRILSLKTDSRTSNLLQKLRENAQKKRIVEDDNYWKEVKKATKKT
ncbi:MAG: hypothetical protein KJI71_04240 [Patescibacteria group bacterium]|nr:hypothetical protein [Patescibacteria group bacterium]